MSLPKIKALIEAATPGPWPCWADEDIRSQIEIDGVIRPAVVADDARFIAASRALMPKLLKVAEIAKKRIGYLQARCINCDDGREDEECSCMSNLAHAAEAEKAEIEAIAALEADP